MDKGHGPVACSHWVPVYSTEQLNIVKIVKVMLMVSSELLLFLNSSINQKIWSKLCSHTRIMMSIPTYILMHLLPAVTQCTCVCQFYQKFLSYLPWIQTIFMTIFSRPLKQLFMEPLLCHGTCLSALDIVFAHCSVSSWYTSQSTNDWKNLTW